MRRWTAILLASVLVGSSALAAGPDGSPPGPAVSDAQLPRIAPTPADQAIHTFAIHPGLRIELVASEPMVQSPVGIAFDEDGRLYVVEMIGYPDRRAERMGRVKLLQSTRRDGHYDKATIFADGLPWPTSVYCYDGGLLVTASPDILWLKDTKGTGVADERKVLFTGFGATTEPLNVQALVNNLVWGLDNRIHGATSFNGGLVTRPGSNDKPLDLRGRDFSFDPRRLDLRPENGGGQHGLSFDEWGRKYVCMNSKAVETFMYDARYAARNPLYAMPAALRDVVTSGMDVFRISPDEPWRVLRTRWRIAGEVTGPVEGGGRPSGYFTGVSGITIYTGDALPEEFRGNAFIGEVANNLVHREVIEPDGVGVTAHRAADEPRSEFLASKDVWFRPVQLANGPDGALYVIDMYREVIEHPWSLPESIKGHLDLHSGSDRGRIWRILPEGPPIVPSAMPRLSKASAAELVSLLASSNGWHRQTAARLLYEREKDRAAAIPLLQQLLAHSPTPLGKIHAIHMLASFDALTPETLLPALSDPDARLREQAVQLSERFLHQPTCPPGLWNKLRSMTDDPAPTVRYQLAFTLGESDQPSRIDALAELALRGLADPWMRAAILSSSTGQESAMFAKLGDAPEARGKPAGQAFLRQLAGMIGRRNDPAEIRHAAQAIETHRAAKDFRFAFLIAQSLREGTPASNTSAHSTLNLDALLTDATRIAQDPSSDPPTRLAAIQFLGTAPAADAIPVLLPLLDARQPQATQLAALASLDRLPDPSIGPELVKRFATFSPRVRSDAVSVLLKRPDRALAVLHGIESGSIRATDLTTSQATFLLRHRDPAVHELAGRLLRLTNSGAAGAREQVVRAYMSALQLRGDAARGHLIYQQRCISCHRLGSEGSAVGPDLVTVRNAGKEKTLINILDPNREIAPNYIAYQAETKSGESFVGILANESAASLTIRQAFGKETTILRADLKRLESQKLSLMPEGLEEGFKPQDFADLLEYIMTAK